jgi:hypothetical protein
MHTSYTIIAYCYVLAREDESFIMAFAGGLVVEKARKDWLESFAGDVSLLFRYPISLVTADSFESSSNAAGVCGGKCMKDKQKHRNRSFHVLYLPYHFVRGLKCNTFSYRHEPLLPKSRVD